MLQLTLVNENALNHMLKWGGQSRHGWRQCRFKWLRGHQRSNHFNFMCDNGALSRSLPFKTTRHSSSGADMYAVKKPMLNYYPFLTKVSMLKNVIVLHFQVRKSYEKHIEAAIWERWGKSCIPRREEKIIREDFLQFATSIKRSWINYGVWIISTHYQVL